MRLQDASSIADLNCGGALAVEAGARVGYSNYSATHTLTLCDLFISYLPFKFTRYYKFIITVDTSSLLVRYLFNYLFSKI